MSTSSQEKLLRIYGYVKDNLYLCHSDLNIGKEHFNSNLLFGLLTSVNKGKQLLMGEYGLGKTSSSEYLLSFIYGVPKKVLVSSTVKGSSQLTDENVKGRLDLGELNNGNEKVRWSFFVTLEPKIIDEFNRIPESKQNIFLEGMDRGNWQYLNEMIPTGDFSMFATINYKDAGNTKLVEAALDRFEVAVESRHPGVNNLRVVRAIKKDKAGISDVVEDESISTAMSDVMLTDNPYSGKKKALLPLRDDFRALVSKRTGLELFSDKDLADINTKIKSVELSKDADLFLDMVVSEMYSCMKFGQKRSNEACIPNCHYKDLACGKKQNCDSVRNLFAEMKYAKSLAWLLGDSEVSTQHLSVVLPYVLWHKMRFSEAFVNDLKDKDRVDPLQLYCTKALVSDIFQRFAKLKPNQQKMFGLMQKQDYASAERLAKEADHPVFYDYLKVT